MEDNKEPQVVPEVEPQDLPVSKDIADFNFVIATVIDYYAAKSGMKGELDEGDEWKEGTKHERMIIPKKVDDAVVSAFLNQLKKFC